MVLNLPCNKTTEVKVAIKAIIGMLKNATTLIYVVAHGQTTVLLR